MGLDIWIAFFVRSIRELLPYVNNAFGRKPANKLAWYVSTVSNFHAH